MEQALEALKNIAIVIGGLSALATLAGQVLPGKAGAVAKAIGLDLSAALAALKKVSPS